MKQSRSLRFDSEPVPESSEEDELPQLQLAQEEMRSNIGRTARGRRKRPSKSEILPVRLLSGLSTEQPEPGASSMRFERSSLSLRSSKLWRCRRKPSAANVRRSCRSEGDQHEAKSIWHEESNNIAIVLNNSCQFKILAHMLNRNGSSQDIKKHISDKRLTSRRP